MNKRYYDRGTKELSPFRPNDPVRVQIQNRWIPATIIKAAETPNSYIIKCSNGSQLCHNQKHLKKDETKRTLQTHPTSWDYDAMESTTTEQVNNN